MLRRLGTVFACCMAVISGCAHVNSNNEGQLQSYPVPVIEASWIRNGDPLEFEGKKWFPVRDIEVLTDNEVYQVGEYREVQLFVVKTDIKPYNRIYTKFGKNKFRYFEYRSDD